MIERRSEQLFKIIQPAIEKASQQYGPVLTPQQIHDIVGDREAQIAVDATRYMIEGVGQIISDAENHIRSANKIFREMFPGQAIISMHGIDDS